MTVIDYVPQNPTDLVIAGEQMRSAALAAGIYAATAPIAMLDLMMSDLVALTWGRPEVIPAEITYAPMVGGYAVPPREVLRSQFDNTLISNNSVISTPCGALYLAPFGQVIMDMFLGSTVRWLLSGVTRDGAGSPLGNCRVVIFETGRIAKDGAPVAAETISDGSGNYAVELPTNTAYEVIAYLPGSPDLAGITLNTITPIANG